jgi:ABC-type Zn uptake system ZnuABC Zn-binding protein ZnuA
MMRLNLPAALVAACVAGLIVAACAPLTSVGEDAAEPYLTLPDNLEVVPLGAGERLRVLATTSIVADAVARVGGDHIDLQTLVPLGVDPHAFEPTPRDVQALAEADLVFINGFGLEVFLGDLLREVGGGVPVVSVSQGVVPLARRDEDHDEEDGEPGEAGLDPHTWLDPNNVARWTETIGAALAAVDPGHAADYTAQAEAYRADLAALDREIREAVAGIPAENRRLVTDHDELGYFAEAYGFTVVGTVIPGASSLAEPSAAELAALLDTVRAEDIPALFVSSVIHPSLVESFASDAGLKIVTLQAHSLTPADGAAPTYLDLMRYNAEAIATALTP